MNWDWIRRLPIAKYIKPVWKALLKYGLHAALNALRVALEAELAKDLAAAPWKVGPLVQKFLQEALALAAHLPAWAAERCSTFMTSLAGRLDSSLAGAVNAGSIGAVNQAIDAVFTKEEAAADAWIDAL
jgi:hypothetical protein